MINNKKILFGVLNWGLGHASRSIPLIKNLLKSNNEVIIASDGNALEFLKKEFPKLNFEKLPDYNIRYSKTNLLTPLYLLTQSPKIFNIIMKEKQYVKEIIKKHSINYIISDNRYGVYNPDIYSVFITHQLRVYSGMFTPVSTWIQHRLINKFNEIYIPDFKKEQNLSGNLSHNIYIDNKLKYIGILSRFTKKNNDKIYDISVVLSGPEPQRSILEKIIKKELLKTDLKIALIQGIIKGEKNISKEKNINIYNYLLSDELEKLLNNSDIIISRSGYSSIMDYYKLKKNVFFIPTPGQYEQEYLAKYLEQKNIAPYCKQNEFNIKKLNLLTKYKGFDKL